MLVVVSIKMVSTKVVSPISSYEIEPKQGKLILYCPWKHTPSTGNWKFICYSSILVFLSLHGKLDDDLHMNMTEL